MCGRFSLAATPDELSRQFEIPEVPEMEPRYNIAPTQPVPIVRRGDAEAPREMVMARWGLVPWWSDDLSIGNRLINARAETVATTAAFRDAFGARRCLVVADGFYEWRKQDGRKQPYRITLRAGGLLAFAGLWDRWRPKAAEGSDPKPPRIESCTIVTTAASGVVKKLHDRMPVVVAPEDYDTWLRSDTPLRELRPIMAPLAPGLLEATPVSTLVNKPANEGAELIEPSGPTLTE